MSASALHDYERVFPESYAFIPDRWLEDDMDLKRKYWVLFGRRSRTCIGVSLAYVELFYVTAAVFRPNVVPISSNYVLVLLLEIAPV